jgi:calpain-7
LTRPGSENRRARRQQPQQQQEHTHARARRGGHLHHFEVSSQITNSTTQNNKNSNNPHNLTRLDVDAGQGGYALVLSQFDKAHDLAFTLSVFATRPFTLRPAPQLPPIAAQLEGVWDSQSAGGRLGQRGFMHNPQFRLALNRPSKLFVELLAPKDLFVSFSFIGGHRGGRRVDSILQGEEALTSGMYRQGYAYAESAGEVPPGLYTVIVSTYEAGLTGTFVLNVRGEVPLQQATSLLPEGDGMVMQVVTGCWSAVEGTAGGSRPPSYVSNPTFAITCSERARLQMRLVCPGGNEPINVTLFRAASSAPLPPSTYAAAAAEGSGSGSGVVVGTSHTGIYTACASGVATPPMELDAGVRYLAVLACYDEGVDAAFELCVYSSSRNLTVTRVH